MLKRRTFLAGVTAAATAASLPLSPAFAQDPTPLKLQMAWIPNVEYAGVWNALERGYMEEEGVDFSYLPGGPNSLQGPVAVASGAADFGITGWLPFLDAVEKGNDFVVVAVPFQRSPLGILSLAKKPILEPADMAGATFLGSGATVKATLEATLALNDMPNDIDIIEVGYSPEPLVAGQGDGQVGYATDQPLQLKHMGMTPDKDYHFTLFDDLGFKSYSGLLFTTREYLDNNRDAVVGFVKAMIKGWEANEADPTEAAKYATEKYGIDYSLDFDHQVEENEVQISLMRPTDDPQYPLLVLDRDLVAGPMVETAHVSGRDTIPDLEQIIDFSIAEEAHAQIDAEAGGN